MSNCDSCSNYQYDEDYECYVCMVDLDEDDTGRFLSGGNFDCPFYQLDNEYLIVRKQMQEFPTPAFIIYYISTSIRNCGNVNP